MMAKRLSGVMMVEPGEDTEGSSEVEWITVDQLALKQGAEWEAARRMREDWIRELLGEWDETVESLGEQTGIVWDKDREDRVSGDRGRDERGKE